MILDKMSLTYILYDIISGSQTVVESSNKTSMLSYFVGSQTKYSSFHDYQKKCVRACIIFIINNIVYCITIILP